MSYMIQGGGVHGNAILSRFDHSEVRAVEHRCDPDMPCLTQREYIAQVRIFSKCIDSMLSLLTHTWVT